MLLDVPTPHSISQLSDAQLEAIKLAYARVKLTPGWRTALEALTDTYGRYMDDDNLLDVEDAAKFRSKDKILLLVVRWYWLGSRAKQELARVQMQALSEPWEARGEKGPSLWN